MTTRKTTILFFNLFTWLGGGEYSVYYLAKNLDRTKIRPVLLFNKRGPFVDKAESDGIETVVIPFIVASPLTLLRPDNIFKNIRASFDIIKLLRNMQVDIIQCSDLFSLFILLPSLIRLRLQVVYNVIVFYSAIRYWVFNIFAFFFVDRIVANSEIVKKDLLSKTVGLGEITSVAYNGVDMSLFFPRTAEERNKIIAKVSLSSDKKIIGLIGRYELWKGHLTFIDTAKQLLRSRNDICFLIVGGAITSDVASAVELYRQEVVNYINELSLQQSIILLDHRNDIPEIMALLDVLVCPSDYEPYGLVLLEAYESGVPVVASSSVGALEVLRGKQGVFVAEPKNPDSFVREINNALRFDRTILTSRDSKKSSDQLSWQTYAQSFEDLYEKIK